MKIAIAQLNYSVGGFEYNKIKIIDAIARAKNEGADLVVFAENAISGLPAASLLARYNFLDQAEETLVEIAAFCDDIAVLVGLPIMQDGGTYSAAAYIKNRKILRYITKKNKAADVDAAYISAGKGCEHIKLAGEKVAVVLGADLYNEAAYSDADVVVVLGADRYSQGRIDRRYEMLSQKAYVADATLVYVNQVGGSEGIVFDGSSAVFNPKGRAVSLLSSFVEEVAFVNTTAENAEIEIPYQDKIANVRSALRLAIGDYFDKKNLTKACLVLSGGIDSSVAAVMLVDALGADRVVALQMPTKFSNDHSATDAEELAGRLGIELVTVPLNEIYRSSFDTIVGAIGEPDSQRLEDNFRMRLRTSLLMAVCEKRNLVPINSANKTEMAIGALTLYGDTAGAISLLGDLYKSDVFALARHLNAREDVIPENILLKNPSAGLHLEGDEELLSYEEIDAILYRLLERWQSRDEIIEAGFEEEVVDRVRKMMYGALNHIFQFCPVVALSSMPLDKSYVDLPKGQ